MSEETKKESPPNAEVLIATGIQLAQEQSMKLAELVGHFQIATYEVFNRNVAAAQQAQNQPVEPSADVGTEQPVAFSPDEGEDKGEN